MSNLQRNGTMKQLLDRLEVKAGFFEMITQTDESK